MSILHELSVAAQRWRHVRRAGAAAPPMDAAAFRAGFAPLLEAAADEIAAHAFVELPANRMPWTASGIVLAPGDEVTIFSAGRIWLSRALDIWVGPQFQIWGRIGEAGEVFNGVHDAMTITARDGGLLFLAGQFPGQFADRQGRVQPDLNVYEKADGHFTSLVIRWKGPAARGLAAMRQAGDMAGDMAGDREGGAAGGVAGLVAAEQDRLANPHRAPDGWHHLWFLGQSEIFRPGTADGAPCISCRTGANVGILQKEVSLPLRPDTELHWEWKLDALPSALPEDTAASHDYFSIAVEFENGRDITYYWSRELPVGHAYWCPLPTWKDREYHIVQRSGEADLGRWLPEARHLYTDYSVHMGEPPQRIVRVWLIAVGIFQRLGGAADFRRITIRDADGTHPVL